MTSLTDRARAAVRSAAGTPALYRAAVSAGASHRTAAEAVAVSAGALTIALRRADGTPGRQNAMRHFVWQACLAARCGEAVAVALAAAQERGRETSHDSRVDVHNNAVATAYAREHGEEIRQGGLSESLSRLADVAARKWETGELIWVGS